MSVSKAVHCPHNSTCTSASWVTFASKMDIANQTQTGMRFIQSLFYLRPDPQLTIRSTATTSSAFPWDSDSQCLDVTGRIQASWGKLDQLQLVQRAKASFMTQMPSWEAYRKRDREPASREAAGSQALSSSSVALSLSNRVSTTSPALLWMQHRWFLCSLKFITSLSAAPGLRAADYPLQLTCCSYEGWHTAHLRLVFFSLFWSGPGATKLL